MITARTDVVGSMLRPAWLLTARDDLAAGRILPAAFKLPKVVLLALVRLMVLPVRLTVLLVPLNTLLAFSVMLPVEPALIVTAPFTAALPVTVIMLVPAVPICETEPPAV